MTTAATKMNPSSPNDTTVTASTDAPGANWPKRIALIAIVVLVVLGSRQLPLKEWIADVNAWVESLGAWGPIAYALFYILAALLFIPGSAITLGAGALFGLGLGTVVVSLASTASAAIAFPLARTLFREKVESIAKQRPAFQAVDRAIEDGGWKIVGLIRLSPVVPFSALNYLLGVTNVRYIPAVLISWIAMLPGTLLYVYIGSISGDVAGGQERDPLQWALLIAGLIATLVVTVVLTRMAKSRMQSETNVTSEG